MAEKSGVAERTLQRWAAELGWRQRLLDRDEHLRLEREAQLAKERAKRLDQQLAVGTLLRQRAHQHFLNNKITRCVDAIQAAKVSIEIERQADLLPDFLIKISCATPEELATMRAELEAERSAAIANGSFVPTPPRRPEHEKELRNANYNE